jgi:hypothetical protein
VLLKFAFGRFEVSRHLFLLCFATVFGDRGKQGAFFLAKRD